MVHTINFDETFRELALLANNLDPCRESITEMRQYMVRERHRAATNLESRIPHISYVCAAAQHVGYEWSELREILLSEPFALDTVIADMLGLSDMVGKKTRTKKRRRSG